MLALCLQEESHPLEQLDRPGSVRGGEVTSCLGLLLRSRRKNHLSRTFPR